jgi:hypothetical protein
VLESRYIDSDLGAGGNVSVTFCYRAAAVSPAGIEGPGSAEACADVLLGGGGLFKRGDVDANGTLEITDPINLLGFLFLGEAQPPCFDAADADDNGSHEITDAVAILGFLFLGEAEPPDPGPSSCGPDPTEEAAGVDFGCEYPAASCQ